MEESLSDVFKKIVTVNKMGKGYKVRIGDMKTVCRVKADGIIYRYEEMDQTDVYGKLDENNNTLY